MKTTSIDTKATPNQKGSIALLIKAIDGLSTQGVHPSQNTCFAGILNEKTSPAPVISGKKTLTTGNRETRFGQKNALEGEKNTPEIHLSDGHHELFTQGIYNPGKAIPDAVAHEPPPREKSAAMSETTAIPGHVSSIPAIHSILPQADTMTSPILMYTETAGMNNVSPGTEGILKQRETGFLKHRPVSAVTKQSDQKTETVVMSPAAGGASGTRTGDETEAAPENRSGRPGLAEKAFMNLTDALSPSKQADYKTQTAFITPAGDNAPGLKTVSETGSESANPASMIAPAEKAGQKTETVFMNRIADTLRQKHDGPTSDAILTQVRRTVITLQDDGQSAAPLKEKGTAFEMQKPLIHPAGGGDKEGATGRGAYDRGDQETFPLRADTPGIQTASETKAAASEKSTGLRAQAIIDQIVDARQTMGNDFGRIRIVLDPPNLGTVDLEIIVRKERVEIVMTADNASVQQALQSRTDDVRAALQRQDLKIETFQVLLQDNGPGQQQAHGGAMYEERRERQAKYPAEDSSPVIAAHPSIEGGAPARGLVSIFV
ncbi:MAG: flagellar hook-length control protein FliK [Deltaproteobacteria bacterium]|nr:flagellar hook-length control protein FliK [Deltaproteobacteria bacterium]